MAQNKKTEEREYLEYFLSSSEGKEWYKKNDIVSCQDSETPDFIFITKNNKKIGLEVTKFIIESEHGKALRHLMTIGNKAREYAKKQYNLDISILIDKLDKRKWCSKTYKEMIDAVRNPGFYDIYDAEIIKQKIQSIIDRNVENLKQCPHLIKESILVQDEFFNISISAFENIERKFGCHVNNECYSKENPFEKLQKTIDKKNEKLNKYLKICDECSLLIYLPNTDYGNYCYFTEKLKQHIFYSKFKSTYIIKQDKIFTENNFIQKLLCTN